MLYQNALLSNDALLDEFVDRYDVRYLLISRSAWIETFQRTSNWTRGSWSVIFVDEKTAFLRRMDSGSVAVELPVNP
jgi:hypothetical protein